MLIYTIANASLDEHPENLLTEYVNELPYPIEAAEGKKLAIGLKSLFINSRLKKNTTVSYINVVLKELESQIGNRSKCIEKIPFRRSGNIEDHNLGLHYVSTSIQHLLLDISVLNRLSVLLTDQTGNRLPLDYGHPTICVFDVVEMYGDYQFSVTCNYKTSIDSFPDNKPSDFIYQFDKEMLLEGEWEVCLSSALLPPNVYPNYGVCGISIGGHVLKINPEKYKQGMSVVKELFKYVSEDSDLQNNFMVKYSQNSDVWALERISGLEETGQLSEEEFEAAREFLDTPIPVIVSPCFNYVMEGKYVRREAYLLPGERVTWGGYGLKPSTGRLRINTAILYTDLVCDSWLGTTPVPLLDIIPLGHHLKSIHSDTEIIRPSEKGDGPIYDPSIALEVLGPFNYEDFLRKKLLTHNRISAVLLRMKAEDELENMPQLYVPKQRTFRRLRSNEFNCIKFATRSVDGTPISLETGEGTLDRVKEMHIEHDHDSEDEDVIEQEVQDKLEDLKGANHEYEITLLFTRVA